MSERLCRAPQAVWMGEGDPPVPIATCGLGESYTHETHIARVDADTVLAWQTPAVLTPGRGRADVTGGWLDELRVAMTGVDAPRATCTITNVT